MGLPPRRAGQRGYALMAALLIAVMTSLVAVIDRLDSTQLKLRRAREAASALQMAKTALVGYAASYRDQHAEESFGYLPCPDATGSGVEQTPCGKGGTVAIGLLPYKTLGLPDLRDADGNCLWYAVSGSFKSSPKTSPFNWDTQGQLTVRSAAGVVLSAPDDASGGAAAIIVAPGPAMAAQRRGATGSADAKHANVYIENDGDVFVDGVLTDAAGTAIANDSVAWVTPKEIFDMVVKRSDFAAFMSDGMAAVRSKLGKQRPASGNALPSTNPFGRQTSNYNFYATWKDQFRYFRCAAGACFADDASGSHEALLLFGGRSASGSPRPASARALPDYFESALAMAQGREFEACSAAPAVFDNTSAASRAADIALCLMP